MFEPRLMECHQCGREIPLGEPFVSVDYNIERTDDGLTITVERADSLLSTCIGCSPSRSKITALLREAGYAAVSDPADGEEKGT